MVVPGLGAGGLLRGLALALAPRRCCGAAGDGLRLLPPVVALAVAVVQRLRRAYRLVAQCQVGDRGAGGRAAQRIDDDRAQRAPRLRAGLLQPAHHVAALGAAARGGAKVGARVHLAALRDAALRVGVVAVLQRQ